MEDSNNLNEAFDDMNQEEMEGEEYPDEDQLNQENDNNEHGEEGEGEEEMLSPDKQINNQNELDINNHQKENNHNEINNINNNEKEGDDKIIHFPNENEILHKDENEEYFHENENNINLNEDNPIENIQSQGQMQEDINQAKLKQLKEEIENITDSDIDDPKYTPYNKNQNLNNNNNINNINNNMNYINNIPNNNNEDQNMNSPLMYMENNNNLLNKAIHDLEVENSYLKTELDKKDEIIISKESLNKEYQNLLSVFKDKLSQSEQYYKTCKSQIEDLEKQLKEKDKIILDYKKRNNMIENNIKNIPEYTEEIKDIQKKYEEMEKQNQEKYNEKEKKLIKDFMDEINRKTKNNEDLRIENEKLKYDSYNQKAEISGLNNKISEIRYENKDILEKNSREISKLKDQLASMEKELNDKDMQIKNIMVKNDNNLKKLKNENNSLIQKINEYSQKNKNCILELMENKHNIEMMKNDLTQRELALKNKDSIIEQLHNQINEMNSEINEKMNDLQIYEENNQREFDDYNNKIQELIQEKNFLEMQNNELSQNLANANNTLREYNDVIINKYKVLEDELYKEKQNNLNLQQKYKDKIETLKIKYNNLKQENNKLKEINSQEINDKPINYNNINKKNNTKKYYNTNYNKNIDFIKQKDIRDLIDVDNHINRTMFNIKSDFGRPINKIRNYNKYENNYIKDNNLTQQDIMRNTTSSYYDPNNKKMKISYTNTNIRNDIDESQKKQKSIINDFKSLLKKMDEKIENQKK
jgi:chromosome segregation ATPase